ncbi:MAG TPA: hypothetical protein PKE31_05095 [Pseudomonadota bacterium]|jgi:spermidine synthase|nr:hypothetical protein [Pseudomonadota bacterium]
MSHSEKTNVTVLETAQGPDGETLELCQWKGGYIVRSGDRVLQSSAARRSERELVNVGLVPLRDRQDITVLLAGLGMGHVLSALLESPRVIRVDVVEHSSAIVEWNKTHFVTLHKEPPLSDPRVHVHTMGLSQYLRAFRYKTLPDVKLEGDGYLAILLDLDEGPSKLLRAANQALYTEDGLQDLEETLRPGGVLVLWAAQRETELIERLKERYQNIAEVVVPVDIEDSPGLDYIYRARRKAQRARALA